MLLHLLPLQQWSRSHRRLKQVQRGTTTRFTFLVACAIVSALVYSILIEPSSAYQHKIRIHTARKTNREHYSTKRDLSSVEGAEAVAHSIVQEQKRSLKEDERSPQVQQLRKQAMNTKNREKVGDTTSHKKSNRGVHAVDITSKIHQHYGVLPHAHRQEYRPYNVATIPSSSLSSSLMTGVTPGRVLSEDVEMLTDSNTVPMNLHLDFSGLYELTAERYTSCFNEGDWVRYGFPNRQTPPESYDHPEVCVENPIWEGGLTPQGGNSMGCWKQCHDYDVLSSIKVQFIREAVEFYAEEIPEYFAVLERDDNLVFEKTEGTYPGFYEMHGLEGKKCMADCAKMSQVRVDASCEFTQTCIFC